MKPKKNPFPDLCLDFMSSKESARLAKSIELTIKVTDPRLDFALRRQAKAYRQTLERYCKDSILSILEADEYENRNRIDENTGLVDRSQITL